MISTNVAERTKEGDLEILFSSTNIDHFHKWRGICYTFVFMLIRGTGFTLA